MYVKSLIHTCKNLYSSKPIHVEERLHLIIFWKNDTIVLKHRPISFEFKVKLVEAQKILYEKNFNSILILAQFFDAAKNTQCY